MEWPWGGGVVATKSGSSPLRLPDLAWPAGWAGNEEEWGREAVGGGGSSSEGSHHLLSPL